MCATTCASVEPEALYRPDFLSYLVLFQFI